MLKPRRGTDSRGQTGGVRKCLIELGIDATQQPLLPLANGHRPEISGWRICLNQDECRKTPVRSSLKAQQKQRLKSYALKSRSHEVSRETARKTPKSAKNDICGVGEVNRYKRKTPRNKAFSGAFVFGAEGY